jgi:hypothetical protein
MSRFWRIVIFAGLALALLCAAALLYYLQQPRVGIDWKSRQFMPREKQGPIIPEAPHGPRWYQEPLVRRTCLTYRPKPPRHAAFNLASLAPCGAYPAPAIHYAPAENFEHVERQGKWRPQCAPLLQSPLRGM